MRLGRNLTGLLCATVISSAARAAPTTQPAAPFPSPVTSAAPSAVLAHWTFDGPPGERAEAKLVVEDVSGNNNLLETFSPQTAPRFVADTAPFTSSRPNAGSASFQARPGGRQRTIDFYAAHAGVTGIDIKAAILPRWTLEAVVRFSDVSGTGPEGGPPFARRFETLVGRDGYNVPNLSADAENPLAPLALKKRGDDNKFSIEGFTAAGKYVELHSNRPAKPGVWYALAATCDGVQVRLYLREIGTDPDYILEATTDFPGGLHTTPGQWTVGRGYYFNTPAEQFFGQIDEVRISAEALSPAQLLASPTPATLPPQPPIATTQPVTRPWPPQPASQVSAHDPTLFLDDDGTYHLFASHAGLQHRRSKDLINWDKLPAILPTRESIPAWAYEKVSKDRPGLWAPDIIKLGDAYSLYYAVSTPGSQRSVMGLLTSPTLDPASPNYHWTDRGPVIESSPRDPYNVIDPAVSRDKDGNPWLVFGSFWQGIYLTPLNEKTGLLKDPATKPIQLANRPGKDAIEASSLFYNPTPDGGWYYLIANWDHCCRGVSSTYKLMIGRSRTIAGPYLDREGRKLTEGHASLLLRSYDFSQGPGHCTMVREKTGDQVWMINHFYDLRESGVPGIQIRPVYFEPDGWPLVGEPKVAEPPSPNLLGHYIVYLDDINPANVELKPDHTFTAGTQTGTQAGTQTGTWSQTETLLTLTYPNARTATCHIGAGNNSFVGRDTLGQIVRALRAN